jgi:hypothetical protein
VALLTPLWLKCALAHADRITRLVCVQIEGRLWLVDVVVKLFTGRYTTEEEMADELGVLGLVCARKATAGGDCGALPLSAVESDRAAAPSRCSAPGATGATRGAPLSLAPGGMDVTGRVTAAHADPAGTPMRAVAIATSSQPLTAAVGTADARALESDRRVRPVSGVACAATVCALLQRDCV